MADTKKKGWQPLDSSGNDYAALVGMSELDKAALEAARSSWADAVTQEGRDAAHRQAEAIRAKYGYSGGGDGSQYLPYGGTSSESGFSYGAAPSYVSKYQDRIDSLARELLAREPFSYDYNKDPNYQQYAEAYTRNGQQAMQDTLGQIAARTGGLASSYAGTASQQTYDGYMAALADKIPELRQIAYEMYRDEGTEQRNNLSMLQGLEDANYGRYADRLNQYNTDRSFNYGVYADDWNRSYQTDADSYGKALDKAQTLGAAGDFSGYQALGYTDAEIQKLQRAYEREQAPAAAGYDAGDGAGSDTSEDGAEPVSLYQKLYDQGIQTYEDAYEYLRRQGYGSTDAHRYAKGLAAKIEAGAFQSLVNVPGYGEISYERAEELVNEGALYVAGLDDNGDPILLKTAPTMQGGGYARRIENTR